MRKEALGEGLEGRVDPRFERLARLPEEGNIEGKQAEEGEAARERTDES